MSNKKHKTDNEILLDLYNDAGEAMNLAISHSNLADTAFSNGDDEAGKESFASMTVGLHLLHKALTDEMWAKILAPDMGKGM